MPPNSAFAAAIWDRQAPPPHGLFAGPPEGHALRFGVYRNNVFAGLVATMAARYPAIERLLGPEYFRGFAAEFVAAHPPQTPVLLDYGAGFADFLAADPDLEEYPYLPGVADLEWARHQALHAADAPSAAISALAAIPPQFLDGAVLAVHPAARVVTPDYPIYGVWAANVNLAEIADDAHRGALLITRPDLDVVVTPLPADSERFIAALQKGCTLSQAATSAGPGFDLSQSLAVLFSAGGVAAVSCSSHQI